MKCPFCQNEIFALDQTNGYNRYICPECPNSTILDYTTDGSSLLRYHINLPNKYSIRISHKTKTVRVYYEKDIHGITPALLTIPFEEAPNVTPSNAEQKIKTYILFS